MEVVINETSTITTANIPTANQFTCLANANENKIDPMVFDPCTTITRKKKRSASPTITEAAPIKKPTGNLITNDIISQTTLEQNQDTCITLRSWKESSYEIVKSEVFTFKDVLNLSGKM